ncbi:MAG: hypothetical protein DSZ32_02380 [Gammaproteobacteria bacterium]|nr:MAG: hypothetical protein DSZ32_02380 [Gammaproteobacteria bacterium]
MVFAFGQKNKPRRSGTLRRNGKHYARHRPVQHQRRSSRSFSQDLGRLTAWSKRLDWTLLRFNMSGMNLRSPTVLPTIRNAADTYRPRKRSLTAGAIKWSSVLSVVLALAMAPGESRNLDWHSSGLALTRDKISAAIASAMRHEKYPSAAMLNVYGKQKQVQLDYSFDPVIQTTADSLFARYKPDFGAFAAIDPETGRILALSSYIKGGENLGNLALHGGFPAASVFKTVTAAAALDQHKLKPNSVVPFNGRSTTLYKRQILKHKNNKWTRRPTLTEAYAKSMNPVFARIGIYQIGGATLDRYARKFGFNQDIRSDVSFDTGKTQIDPANDWNIAEAASGFTRTNTLSPLHGAMLAASIVNDGVMMKPFVITRGTAREGMLLYQSQPEQFARPISASTARAMRQLMRQTVKTGTARKSFRRFLKSHKGLDVGGKTGSLSGTDPKGKTDWFIGYAERNGKKIAYASVTVNKEKWTVKSHYVARKVVESWLSSQSMNIKVANGD